MAPLLRLDSEARSQGQWDQQDLRDILQHQLTAPLLFDQEQLSAEERQALEQASRELAKSRGGVPVYRFEDVLLSDRPPLALLQLVKEYAKMGDRQGADAGLPEEVATVLYYAAIFVALSRCGQRISSLDDAALARGGRWVVDQPWVSQPVRQIVVEAMARLGGDGHISGSADGAGTHPRADAQRPDDASELSDDEPSEWRIGGTPNT
jgi:hypothetical protein